MTSTNIKIGIVVFVVIVWLCALAVVWADDTADCPLLNHHESNWIAAGTIDRYGYDTKWRTNIIRVVLSSGGTCVLEVRGLRKAQLPSGMEIGLYGIRKFSKGQKRPRLIVTDVSPLWPI